MVNRRRLGSSSGTQHQDGLRHTPIGTRKEDGRHGPITVRPGAMARPLRHGRGVAGALIGLLFVAISINLDRIITGANLPRRALETLAVLVAILTVAVLGLVPQPGWAIGVETLLLAGGILTLLVGRLRDAARPIEQRRFRGVPAVVLAAFALPLVAAGLT